MLYEVHTYDNDVGRTVHEVRSPSGLNLGNFSSYQAALVRATFLARMRKDYEASDMRHTTTPGMYVEQCFAAYVKSMRLIGAPVLPRAEWERAVATAPRH
jgi:hypothetical protein